MITWTPFEREKKLLWTTFHSICRMDFHLEDVLLYELDSFMRLNILEWKLNAVTWWNNHLMSPLLISKTSNTVWISVEIYGEYGITISILKLIGKTFIICIISACVKSVRTVNYLLKYDTFQAVFRWRYLIFSVRNVWLTRISHSKLLHLTIRYTF